MNDPLFIRWINASVNLYFKGAAGTIPFYIEGQELDYEAEPKLAELRLTGPRVHELSKNSFKVELDVDIMCTCKLGENDYTIHDVAGVFYAVAAGPIDVYKQDGTDAPPYIGCLILRNDLDSPREIIPWGLVQVSDGQLRVNQTSVSAQYMMRLDL